MNPYDPENKMENIENAYPMTYMEDMVYDETEDRIDFTCYAGDTGELLDTVEKHHAHLQRQIDELANFLLLNHDREICGSAVETAIAIIRKQNQKIRRLETVQRDYAREILNGVDNTMHQPVHHEAKSNKPHPAKKPFKMRKINLIDPKQGGPGEAVDPIDSNEAYERARSVV